MPKSNEQTKNYYFWDDANTEILIIRVTEAGFKVYGIKLKAKPVTFPPDCSVFNQPVRRKQYSSETVCTLESLLRVPILIYINAKVGLCYRMGVEDIRQRAISRLMNISTKDDWSEQSMQSIIIEPTVLFESNSAHSKERRRAKLILNKRAALDRREAPRGNVHASPSVNQGESGNQDQSFMPLFAVAVASNHAPNPPEPSVAKVAAAAVASASFCKIKPILGVLIRGAPIEQNH